MYVFATIALLGLAVAKVVDLVHHSTDLSRTLRTFLAIGLGLVVAWATDYSAFGDWGISFRSAWMGPVATGLAVAGMAAVWHEVLDLLGSYARRSYDEASEIESRIPRRAA
jgi:hypothetical protein